jgi:hypothetical protein
MNSKNRVRRLPPVCALVAVLRMLTARLRLESRYVGSIFVMEDGQRFRVFRHMSLSGKEEREQGAPAVLVVRFKFARFPQALNRLLSLISVPLIGGYPGFRQKLWMVQEETGYWQGVYEWESTEAVERYRRSFVLGLMNRRAEPDSISETVIPRTLLEDYVGGRIEQD